MLKKIKNKTYKTLRWSEKYTKTDMVYLAKGGSWLTLNQIITSLFSLATAIAFANLIPKEVYGNYKFIVSVTNVLVVFSLMGMGQSLTKSIARGYEGDFWKSFKISFKWSLLGSLVSLVLSVYYLLQENIVLSISFLIVSFFVPTIKNFSLFQAYLHGKKLFKEISKFNIWNKVISSIALIITIFLTDNIFIIVLAFLTPSALVKIYYFFSVLKKNKLNKETEPGTISYGKHLSLMTSLKTLANEADKILIFHFIGSAELAVYSIALYSVAQASSIINNLKTLAFPKLSERTIDEIKRTLPKKILTAEILIIPFVIVYILIAPIVFPIFFPQYPESILYTQILALTIITMPRSLLSDSLIAKQQTKSLYKIKILGPVIRLSIYYSLTRFYGLNGLIAGVLLGEVALLFLYSYYFKKMK